jgi:hypothetical protein
MAENILLSCWAPAHPRVELPWFDGHSESAKVSAEGVKGVEGRKTEAAEFFGRVQGRDSAASAAQRQEHRPAGTEARDRRDADKTFSKAMI